MKDMTKKGRGGLRRPPPKLTVDNVREIRKLASIGAQKRALGKRFGVLEANIRRIINRETWIYIDAPKYAAIPEG